EQQRLINRVFDFTEAEVREAMVPRINVAAVPVAAGFREVKEAFRSLRYSRLPVYRGRLDEIIGVLFLKDVAALSDIEEEHFDLESLLHPPLFVPATARLGTALSQMQTTRTHLAFVIDEHGGLEGIVTLEDLLEEIVGEINDEYDEEVRSQIIKENGSFLLDGMLAVRDLNRRLSLHLPEEAGYTTLAGFLMAQTGHVPQQGEAVDYDGARFTIERVDGRSIRRVRFTPASAEDQNAAKASIASLVPVTWVIIGTALS
nr:HlyC/CorC family transporter [Pyrinomonadaceae bacterium]